MQIVHDRDSLGTVCQADAPTASEVAIPDVRVLIEHDPLTPIPHISPADVSLEVLVIPDRSGPHQESSGISVALLHEENVSALRHHDIASITFPLAPRYHIADARESGLGLFAAVDVDRGELILQERPLLVYPQLIPFHSNRPVGQQYPELDHALELMSAKNREAFFKLMNAQVEETSLVKGIIDTNALFLGPLPGAPHLYAAVCEDISRINHR